MGDAMKHLSRRQLLAAGLGVPGVALAGLGIERIIGRQRHLRARGVRALVDAQPTVDGAGVKLSRAIGSAVLPMLDPFLLLDEIHSDRPDDYLAGFPTHPHRGFETVTYMLEGAMEHRDSLGNHGHLGPGSVQWMTAGHGIVHSEMPKQENGLMWGYQLWVNLPAAQKLVRPRYQDLAPERVVDLELGGARVRLVAGELSGRKGPVEGIVTAPQMLDVRLGEGGRFETEVPRDHNAFVYQIEGSALLGPEGVRVRAGQLAVLDEGDRFEAKGGPGRFLLLAGRPIGEPVARYGPFVMNTRAEIQQAVDDYRAGKLVQM